MKYDLPLFEERERERERERESSAQTPQSLKKGFGHIYVKKLPPN